MTQQDHVAVRTLEPGPAVLAVHGGGGPPSMRQIVEGLSVDHEVLLPTHPGWAGQPRDPAIRSVPDLAQRCLRRAVTLADLSVQATLVPWQGVRSRSTTQHHQLGGERPQPLDLLDRAEGVVGVDGPQCGAVEAPVERGVGDGVQILGLAAG